MNKRELIFSTVLDLIKNEGRLDTITVSSIAKEAGIGKGTVYEYFESKEEIIIETVKFMMDDVFGKLINTFEVDDFCVGMTNFIDQLIKVLEESESNLGMVNFRYIKNFIPESIRFKIKNHVNTKKGEFFIAFSKMYELGRKQNIISEGIEMFDMISSISLIVSMVANYVFDDDFSKSMSLEEFKDKLYNIIMKILK